MNTRPLNRLFQRGAVALALALPAAWVCAQTFPSQPVPLLVRFPAGGELDVVALGRAEQIRTELGQAVVGDNRFGAGGTVGSAAVA
ncbi:MAG: tripartite tricarboxylate transporter substrate binding protein, partial [Rubrivivax sp.]